MQQRVAEAQGNTPPALGLRKVGEVWIVSIPSFTWTGEGIATMQGFIDELGRQAATLHAARHVVIDVRGNDGGSST